MLNSLSKLDNVKTRSVSAENFYAEKGKGAMSTDGAAAYEARELGQGWKVSPYIVIKPGETATFADIECMGAIKHIWCALFTWNTDGSVQDHPTGYRNMILRIYWDGCDKPSVEAPLGDFFACADHRNYTPLSSLAVCVNPQQGFNCYWEMPFKKGFRMTLENRSVGDIWLYYQVDFEEKEIDENSGYFHAQFRRTNPLPYKQAYTILDNVKGRGKYVGTYIFWGVNNCGWWGEGEIKFYMDGDKDYPTICGTGTEDYFCGSHNFDVGGKYKEYTTPYAGLSKVIEPDGTYASQQRFSMYRWHICDPIYFNEELKVTIQALGWRSERRYLPLQDDISSVAYWYQDTLCDTFPELPDRNALEII